ncbi:hypothetical protein MCBRY_003779 [Methylocystis bryophila]
MRRRAQSEQILDHDAFERNRSNADNVIDSKVLERDWREKPVPTFSHRALDAQTCFLRLRARRKLYAAVDVALR